MKVAAACLITVFKQQVEQWNNLGLMLVTDEEIGGFNGTKLLITKIKNKPEFIIAGEPTDLQIGNEAKGVISLEVDFQGKTAHGSRPWLGDNAILKAAKSLEKINKSIPLLTEEKWEDSWNAGIIWGGKAENQVPDKCSFMLDIRYLPDTKPQDVINKFQEIIPDGQVKIKSIDSPILTMQDDHFVQLLSRSIKAVTGEKAIFRKGHGSSDIRFFTEKNIPAVQFGPSGGNSLHCDDEWVSLESVEKYVRILTIFLNKFNEK